MWDFIKYCLHCFFMVISAAFGKNPEDATFKNLVVGVITMFVLVGLWLLILWLYVLVVNKFRK